MADTLPISDFTTEELGDLIGFDPEEVKENRAGKISTRQRKRMRFLSLMGIIPAFVFIYIVFNRFSIVANPLCSDACRFLAAGQGIVGIAFVIFCITLALRLTIWLPKVSSKAGIFKVQGGFLSAIRPYSIQVKDKKLSHSWANKRNVLPRGNYEGYVQAYYLDLIWLIYPILSAEPIDEVSNQKDSE